MTYDNNTQFADEGQAFQELKRRLPNYDLSNMKRATTAGEYKGPCPFCGGNDRFFIQTQGSLEGHGTCRKCGFSGDKIDIYKKKTGKNLRELFQEYMPECQYQAPAHTPINGSSPQPTTPRHTRQDKPLLPQPSCMDEWNNQCLSIKSAGDVLKPFIDRRGFSEDIINGLIASGRLKIRTKNGKQSVAYSFSPLPGGDVGTIQYQTIDGEAYPFTVKNGDPVNKILGTGHKAGGGVFFSCGPDIKSTKTAIITESVNNAITAHECFPDVSCIALGGSTFTGKLSELLPYMEALEKVIVCGDNDSAGDKMAIKARQILGEKVHSIRWPTDTPQEYDLNDLLQTGQKGKIIDLIQTAPPVHVVDLPDETPVQPMIVKYYDMGTVCRKKITIEYIVEDFLEEYSTNIISGAGGTGKSNFSMNVALEIAKEPAMYQGNEFEQGGVLFDQFIIPKPRTSLFVQSENNIGQVNFRFNKMAGNCPVCKRALKNIYMPNIMDDVLTSGKTFEDPVFYQYIIDLIHKIEDKTGKKIDILCVDPIISFLSCDENHSVDVRRQLDVLSKIAISTKVTPVVIHHAKKDDSGYRGTSAFRDWCRSHIELKRTWGASERLTENETGQVVKRQASIPLIKVHHEKSNNFREFEDFTLKMNQDLTFSVTNAVVSPEKARQGGMVAEVLSSFPGQTADSTKQLTKAYIDRAGVSSTSARRHIVEAVKHGYINQETVLLGSMPSNTYKLPK